MTHVKQYIRADGTVVHEHEDTRQTKQPWWSKHPVLAKVVPAMKKLHGEKVAPLLRKPGAHDVLMRFPDAKPHPQPREGGGPAMIYEPSAPSAPDTWTDRNAIATFVPGGPAPEELNGVPMTPWIGAPDSDDEWDTVEGQLHGLRVPPLETGKKDAAAGVVIEEPDGRIWIIHPTNQFGGYRATFPKGHLEEGINSQASAIKEAYEEAGLQVEITGFLMDVDRTTTVCRYYTARRVGGTPAAMGWESQAASLVPRAQLYEVLNRRVDHPLAEALGAGPAPAPPPMAWSHYHPKGPKAPDVNAGDQPVLLPWEDDQM